MEGLKGKVIVALAAVLVIIGAGSYQLWQKTSVPVIAEFSRPAQNENITSTHKAGLIMVYISGAVNKPGMYEVETGLRILDVVNLANGVVPGADVNKINMAQLVKDGLHIAVPMTVESKAIGTGSGGANTSDKININSANKNELDKLPGVGPALADKIIEYRQTNGGFKDINEIRKVPGIGEAKFKQMASKLTI